MGRVQEAEESPVARDFRLHSHNVYIWSVGDKTFPGAVAHSCVRGLLDAAICERWLAVAIVPLPALRAIVFWLQHNQPSLCPLHSSEVSAGSRLTRNRKFDLIVRECDLPGGWPRVCYRNRYVMAIRLEDAAAIALVIIQVAGSGDSEYAVQSVRTHD
jgi:hypothetical protein